MRDGISFRQSIRASDRFYFPHRREAFWRVISRHAVRATHVQSRLASPNRLLPRQNIDAAFAPRDRPAHGRQGSHHRFARGQKDRDIAYERSHACQDDRESESLSELRGHAMIRAHESILNDGTILAMWKVKLDTHTIAKLLHVH